MVRTRPNRLLRVLFRLPVYLYRLRLGRVLGTRFLLLTHRGRRSGHLYQTAIEVVRWNAVRHEATVVAAWGERSDWYRNIQASPAVAVQIAGRRYDAPGQRFLAPDETYDLLEQYRREHRWAATALSRLLGWPVNDPQRWPDFARAQHAVAFSVGNRQEGTGNSDSGEALGRGQGL